MDGNSDSSSSCGESVPEINLSVVDLQSEFFPVQPRGGNITGSREFGNGPVMSSTEPSTQVGTSPPGKLKEPRDLYSTTTLLHPLKWPVECQVIPEKIRHLDVAPGKLEPFYTPTGKEPMPQPVGVEMGTVVYDYQPKLSVDYFCRATVGGSQDLDDYGGGVDPQGQDSSTLKFESRFESGNLAKAIKVTNMYYELYLRPDLYTERHAQWFYFRIQNTRDNIQYRFSIVNFNKPDSLYRYGLKVLMYSEKEAQLNGVGWTRTGQNIAYFKNDISPDDNGPYYTLTFNLKFRHSNDTVYLAQCYPYTYSTLQNYLKSIEEDEFKSQLLTIRLLCRSLAGNNVHVLTVTSPPSSSSSSSVSGDSGHISQNSSTETEPSENTTNKKPVIVISARVHPGESQSSYMMKGIIDFLTSNCSQAKELRDRFIFKLIPMLNPDGVIVGNSRCCLLGQDLNRQYRTVLREAFPQIYHTKVMLRRLQEENGLFLYCDLHGHSRKHNVFIYGCENRRVPEKKLVEQVFPLMMHKNAADKFSFQNCKFKIQKNKEGTGRIFVWTLGVANSYTLEISLGGSTMPSRQYTHFSTADYEACGRHFCETLLDYSDPAAMKETLRERILQKLIDEGSTADEPKNVQLSDYSSLSNSETDGEGDDESETGVKAVVTEPEKKVGLQVPSTPRGNLKRQANVRKQLPLQTRQKSAVKKLNGSSTEIRSPLPVHRASVDFTRVLLKQKKLEEPLVIQPPLEVDQEIPAKEPLRLEDLQASPSFRRLTKFRRKSKRHHVPVETSIQPNLPMAKCATILFDDPFKPPGRPGKQNRKNCYFARRKDCLPFPQDGAGCDENLMDWFSGTEDECDPCDRPAPTIKITNCCDSEEEEMKLEREMLAEMGRLSLDTERKSEGLSPFAPSFPVGKGLLQTLYPVEKEKSKNHTKMTVSLSDTTISTKSGLSGRRGSVSSLNGGISPGAINRSKLQATGSTILGCPGDSTRRRVSWTGTLTVSVPSVPQGILGFPRSSKAQPQKKKSFRKSRSLNDSTKDGEFSGESCASTGSVSMEKIPGVVISTGPSGGILGHKSNPVKWTGSRRLPASSSSIVAAVVSTATATVGKVKKRGKLKRTKNKA